MDRAAAAGRWAISRLPTHAENSELKCDLLNGDVERALPPTVERAALVKASRRARVCSVIKRVCSRQQN